MLKQVIIIRKDLEMTSGKKCVQACHACIGSYEKTPEAILKSWRGEGQKKVTLEVGSREELIRLKNKAKKSEIPYFLVKDAGLTELEPGTVTALGIGPDKEEKIDKITGNVPLLKD
ncbi:MAG: peptidyl-tRNA hydrolase [Candidatus Aenigmarchaeota archaeon]|nr:peptidyl-tRNA hydrolase [Candidatus Aenigmarchaeota archaeon]